MTATLLVALLVAARCHGLSIVIRAVKKCPERVSRDVSRSASELAQT